MQPQTKPWYAHISVLALCIASISVVSFLLGMYYSSANTAVPVEVEAEEGMAMTHMHPMTELDPSLPVPAVSVEAIPDEKDGYNIHVTTEHFAFTPEMVNGDVVSNSGHAHIYVNGTKVARLYGPWFNLPSSALQSGRNEVMVTLNANDHSEWSRDGMHIMDMLVLTAE